MHEKANKQIERAVKWIYLTDLKYSLSMIFFMIPLFIQNYVNYYIHKLGDESFKLPYFAAYVHRLSFKVDLRFAEYILAFKNTLLLFFSARHWIGEHHKAT